VPIKGAAKTTMDYLKATLACGEVARTGRAALCRSLRPFKQRALRRARVRLGGTSTRGGGGRWREVVPNS